MKTYNDWNNMLNIFFILQFNKNKSNQNKYKKYFRWFKIKIKKVFV